MYVNEYLHVLTFQHSHYYWILFSPVK